MNILHRPPYPKSLADLLSDLGDIPASRVRLKPAPGTATIDDLLDPDNEGCELVDGTLVEKPMGQGESFLAASLSMLLNQLIRGSNSGFVTGEQGLVELPDGPVRGPDISYFAWDRLPGRRRPTAPIPRLAPDLAVEVLSPSNTRAEMARKRGEYFRSGVRLVWEIDPRARTVRAYTAEDQVRDLGPADALDGGAVLPGFAVPLADLFAELDRHG